MPVKGRSCEVLFWKFTGSVFVCGVSLPPLRYLSHFGFGLTDFDLAVGRHSLMTFLFYSYTAVRHVRTGLCRAVPFEHCFPPCFLDAVTRGSSRYLYCTDGTGGSHEMTMRQNEACVHFGCHDAVVSPMGLMYDLVTAFASSFLFPSCLPASQCPTMEPGGVSVLPR